MTRRPPPLALVLLLLVFGVAACGLEIDLAKALDVTDVFSGWYDSGVKDGKNFLIPSITFRLHNKGTEPIFGVELTVTFWRDGTDGEWDEALVSGIGSSSLPPGASTDPITVRLRVGYTLEGPRSEFFNHSLFRDATAKIFAKRSGKIVPMGEFKLDRRILPHVSSRRP